MTNTAGRKAFIHVNGVNYELANLVNSEHDPAFQTVERQMQALAGGSGGQQVTLDVLIDGTAARLHLTTQGVFAAAAFLEHEGHAAAFFAGA